jgi:alpha-glucosidase
MNQDFFQRVQMPGNPLARPQSVVTHGNARFTALTARLLRLEWSPTGEFTDAATFAFPNRLASAAPALTERKEDGWLLLSTEVLTLRYRLDSGAFTADNLEIQFCESAESRVWRPGASADANLHGTRRTLDGTGGAVTLESGLLSREGWALFDDSASVIIRPDNGWVAARPTQSLQDWYFFGYGTAYSDALAEYAQFGGAAPLIPRYALGVWWSRFWPYSAADLERLVEEFAEQRMPLDVLVVDMDWHLPGHWTGYTWNRELFPDPQAFLAGMRARGLRVTLNLHPAEGVGAHEAAYLEMARALGQDATSSDSIPFRIGDRQFAEQYFLQLHHPLEEQGVDFWWLDWQQGEISEIPGLDPLLWLNHLHFSDARRRGQRPLIFSRWGSLGSHRYPIGFSGDTFVAWETLAALPRFTSTAANVGFGWWSHDIGGHFGATEPELYTRWVQFGALSPTLRLHSSKHALAERRPWAFPATTRAAVRAAFELRYQLVPYLYTAARQNHETNVALCRPMYYAYPEHEAAYHASDQYMLGADLIAAPITAPLDPATGLATQDVWIPPGTWYRFESGAAFTGPRWVRLTGDLNAMPLFARSGAIIPLAQPALHLVDVPRDWLELLIFPGGASSSRLYEDDGESEAYLKGEYEWTTFRRAQAGEAVTVEIGAAEGACPALPAKRAYRVTFAAATRPERVTDERGALLPWSFDAARRRLTVTLAPRDRRERAAVHVQWSAPEHAETMAPTEPFAHVIAYTASDEAQRQLARLILIPPYNADGQAQPCRADVLWRDVQSVQASVTRQTTAEFVSEFYLTPPLALDIPDTTLPRRWEVETRFLSAGSRAADPTPMAIYRGPTINPPIQRWNVRYASQEEAITLQADAAKRLTITDPFEAILDTTRAATAEASVSLELDNAATVRIETWTSGMLTLALDGREIPAGDAHPTLGGRTILWPVTRSAPITLEPGAHTVTLRLSAPEGRPWVFGALLLDESGLPFIACNYP